MLGEIKAICTSRERGTTKQPIASAVLQEEWGIEGDAHAGTWHRQVSLLSAEKIEEFNRRGANAGYGAFGENLVVEGYDFRNIPIGTRFRCGDVLLEITQIGKKCHSHCAIYEQTGDCIMPREGVFARVLSGGELKPGDILEREETNLYVRVADRAANKSYLLATLFAGAEEKEKMLLEDGRITWQSKAHGILSRYVDKLNEANRTQLLETDGLRIFCELIGNRPKLVVCGGGHVSVPVIAMAKQIGFSVTVIEDRAFFADRAKDAGADTVICDSFEHALEQLPGSPDTYFVIVTRAHAFDRECLRAIVKKPNAYVGLMGSRSRVALLKKSMEEEGIDGAVLEKVHTPIGLEIFAQTPEEIAVSIVAELIQVKNEGKRSVLYEDEILELLSGRRQSAGAMVLALIVSRTGSAPREIGTKMLVLEDGSFYGTIGGGYLEHQVLEESVRMLREAKEETAGKQASKIITVTMSPKQAKDAGMVCGGTVEVFLEILKGTTAEKNGSSL